MKLALCLTLSFLATTAFAQEDLIQPDRPGIADGSSVVGRGVAQLEIGGQIDRVSEAGFRVRAWTTPTLFRYGFTDRFEGRLETDAFSRVSVRGFGGSDSESGFGALSAGFKYRFRDGDLPLAAIVSLTVPSGSDAFEEEDFSGTVRIATDLDIGEMWSINPNAGLAIEHDDSDQQFVSAIAALTVQYNISDRFQPFADLALQIPEREDGGTSAVLDAGVQWIVRPDMQLDVSAGRRLSGSATSDSFVAAGVSIRFQ